jgi:hypothetical protein
MRTLSVDYASSRHCSNRSVWFVEFALNDVVFVQVRGDAKLARAFLDVKRQIQSRLPKPADAPSPFCARKSSFSYCTQFLSLHPSLDVNHNLYDCSTPWLAQISRLRSRILIITRQIYGCTNVSLPKIIAVMRCRPLRRTTCTLFSTPHFPTSAEDGSESH